MNKWIVISLVLAVSGCKSTDIKNIADSVSDIAGIADGNTAAVYKHDSQQYTNKSETFYITKAERTSHDFGNIRSITAEKNPKGMTMVRFLGFHQDSGAALESKQYLYKQDMNGWLDSKPVTLFRSDATMINSGVYYLKAEASQGKFYTSGTVELTKGVTNVIEIELQ